MKRSRNFLFASAALIAGASLLTATAPGRAIAQEFVRVIGDVTITNTLDSPVPTRVSGEVAVATPHDAIQAELTLKTSNVFQHQVTVTLDPGEASDTHSFSVPVLKLLKIESCSGFAQMGHEWQKPAANITTTANSVVATHFLLPQLQNGSWFVSDVGWGPVAYADPASKIEVLFARFGPNIQTTTATLTLTLTGHFIEQ